MSSLKYLKSNASEEVELSLKLGSYFCVFQHFYLKIDAFFHQQISHDLAVLLPPVF